MNIFNPSADVETSQALVGNWDFKSAQPDALAGVHPYPAKFISEIPRRLIQSYPPPKGTVVLDPFCGSGTTLVEAQSAGLRSHGIDVNPIATLMSRVKTSHLPSDAEERLVAVMDTVMSAVVAAPPTIPRLDHWFNRDVQSSITSITGAIDAEGGESKDLLRLALSSIIVRVSNQESDTRYAAIAKKVNAPRVLGAFHSAARKIIAALSARSYLLPPAAVLDADILTLDPARIDAPVGLVVTSPPYPNAYEYWLYHKYRMWWLGYDPLAVKAQEIGARAHFFKGAKSHKAEDFQRQMRDVFATLALRVVPHGHVCFVVGRSRIHGVVVDNAETVSLAATATGFVEVVRRERMISPTRKSFNLSHANIKTESVLVFRRLP